MSAPLRRKRPFCVVNRRGSKYAAIPCYLNRHPDLDYHRCHNLQDSTTKWVGQHRQAITRQLVAVKRLPRASLSDVQKLYYIAHNNVVRPESFYHADDELFIVFEYLHLDLFDLFPLFTVEVTCVMKQIISGLHHLKDLGILFGIDIIQVDEYGLVKIVLDWNWEVCAESALCHANEGYLVAYLEEVMAAMAQSCFHLPAAAANFLKDGILPPIDHPFISKAGGPQVLKRAIQFAIRKKMLACEGTYLV